MLLFRDFVRFRKNEEMNNPNKYLCIHNIKRFLKLSWKILLYPTLLTSEAFPTPTSVFTQLSTNRINLTRHI